jgi:RecB family endonuclease NucS
MTILEYKRLCKQRGVPIEYGTRFTNKRRYVRYVKEFNHYLVCIRVRGVLVYADLFDNARSAGTAYRERIKTMRELEERVIYPVVTGTLIPKLPGNFRVPR